MIKTSISYEAMDKLTKEANKRGFTRATGWNGVGKVRGFGKYVIWLSRQELEDVRPDYMKQSDIGRLLVGDTVDWQGVFKYKRLYRVSIVIPEREILDKFVQKGMELGMVPRRISGAAYLGMILEGIGEGLINVK